MCHKRFRPQQGLSIMNDYMRDYRDAFRSFRPQQGLSIMNTNGYGITVRAHVIVSVPNRG